MKKPKESTVHHIVAPKKWELSRQNERIIYPPDHAGPIQMDWRNRENYTATDLNYRGKANP